MKKTLVILGGMFLALIVAAAVAISILSVKGNALDRESKEYADAAILAVISGWDMTELKRRVSPEFASTTNSKDLGKLFGLFRMLGKLREYQGSKGQAIISVTPQKGKVITATYVGRAEFEKGPAEIQITLIQHEDGWQILGFRVNSRLLFEAA